MGCFYRVAALKNSDLLHSVQFASKYHCTTKQLHCSSVIPQWIRALQVENIENIKASCIIPDSLREKV